MGEWPGSASDIWAEAGEDAIDGGAGLAPCAVWLGGLRDVEAGLADEGGEKPREGVDGQGVDLAVVDGLLQPGPQQPKAMPLHQVAPCAVAEHGRAVNEHDALKVAAGTGIQKRLETLTQLGRKVGPWR